MVWLIIVVGFVAVVVVGVVVVVEWEEEFTLGELAGECDKQEAHR